MNQIDSPSVLYTIIGFLIPIAGWIMWLVWHKTYPVRAKYAGIAGIIGFFVVGGGIWGCVGCN